MQSWGIAGIVFTSNGLAPGDAYTAKSTPPWESNMMPSVGLTFFAFDPLLCFLGIVYGYVVSERGGGGVGLGVGGLDFLPEFGTRSFENSQISNQKPKSKAAGPIQEFSWERNKKRGFGPSPSLYTPST